VGSESRVGEGDGGGDVVAERGERGERVRAGDEEAGVDRASDVRCDVNLGDDGDATHVLDVPPGQAAAHLGEQHDAVGLQVAHGDAA
jgi:hypothetical protein